MDVPGDLLELEEVLPLSASGTEGGGEDPGPKRRRGAGKTYQLLKKCDGDYVKTSEFKELHWRQQRSHETEEGVKVYYGCGIAGCGAALYILYHSDSTDSSIYVVDGVDHDHSHQQQSRGPDTAVRKEIEKLFDLGITKPKAVATALERINIRPPSIRQLEYVLSTLRRSKFGSPSVSFGELTAWLQANSVVPENHDEGFVAGYESSFQPGEGAGNYFRFTLTTVRLLKLASKGEALHADATYKLNWNGFPVLIVGTSDKARKFHPFALAVTTNEATEDFRFVFSSVKSAFFKLWPDDPQPAPTVLIADAASAITCGFREAFGNAFIRVTCWAHAKRAMDKKLEAYIKDKDVRNELQRDIDTLQLASSNEEFDLVWNLFRTKWMESAVLGVKDYVTYMRLNWIDNNKGWFEGCAPCFPSTNNGLESTNAVIKRQHTLRERLPLMRFLEVAKSAIVHGWSSARVSTGLPFAREAPWTTSCWTAGYHWAVSTAHVTSAGGGRYYVASSSTMASEPTLADFKEKVVQYKEMRNKWLNLEQYQAVQSSLWFLENITSASFKSKGTCTCRNFVKEYRCKHVIGVALRLKLCEAPLEAQSVPIGQKRKRGRPSKAKKALIVQ
jgi:hypothetical protein